MTLLALITSGFVLSIGILAFILSEQIKKTFKYKSQSLAKEKNNLYLVNTLKEIQSNTEYEKDLENVINAISKNIESNYPYSALSSIFINDNKLIFKSKVQEALSRGFIDHVRDTMIQSLNIGGENKPHTTTEESITGVPLDDQINSNLMSTFNIPINIGSETRAIINLSSTINGIYKNEEDMKALSTAADLASGFLTRIHIRVSHEKGKSLSMINSFSEGIFVIDRQNELTAINSSAQNFLNIHKEKPTISDILVSLPNTYNFKDKIDQAIAQNKQIIETDLPLGAKSFKIIITPVLEMGSLEKAKSLPRQSEASAGVIGVSVLLHETTIEKSLSQVKEDFTNIMVHELRSPLTAIKASSEFLLSQAELTDIEKKELTHMISESSKKMLDEISLILDSAKMDAGLFSIRKTKSDLKKLIADRIAVFEPLAAEKTIKLSVDIDPALSTFSFDPIRIDEVVNNLLSNSLKFTPTNGTISVKAHTDAGKVSVSISDTGEGVAKDKQHLLFAKFQQAPTDGEHVGTGLGLYVVKGVIEAHSGTVDLKSEPGHGTTITFTLPLSDTQHGYTPLIKPANPMAN